MPDIWRASRRVLDEVVEETYGSNRKIQRMEVLAGHKVIV